MSDYEMGEAAALANVVEVDALFTVSASRDSLFTTHEVEFQES